MDGSTTNPIPTACRWVLQAGPLRSTPPQPTRSPPLAGGSFRLVPYDERPRNQHDPHRLPVGPSGWSPTTNAPEKNQIPTACRWVLQAGPLRTTPPQPTRSPPLAGGSFRLVPYDERLRNQPGPRRLWRTLLAAVVILLSSTSSRLFAQHHHSSHPQRTHQGAKPDYGSIADTRLTWPTNEHVIRVLSLRDYNTRIVLLGTTLLGMVSGVVGTFMLLRKRALIGDAISHATLPGIGIAFILLESIQPGLGKSLPGLLFGAFAAGLIGMVSVLAIRNVTRIKDDAALAIVLSIYFGFGIAMFTIIQRLPTGNAAGLNHFIFGKAASMVAEDVYFIAVGSFLLLLICGLLFKEFAVLCFDENYAATQGWPILSLDLLLMGLVTVVTVIALQSVGILLAVALLIIPAAAARFWSDRLFAMALTAAAIGGFSALMGVFLSALFPRLATGAIIVLSGSVVFFLSMLFGVRRGLLRRGLGAARTRRNVGRHDLMRAFYECLEPLAANSDLTQHPVTFPQLLAMRSWNPARVRGLLRKARKESLIVNGSDGIYQLTEHGAETAKRMAWDHRLWELYLITHADIAPSHVDRDADTIEHVLEPEVIAELESLLADHYPQMTGPDSPHAIDRPEGMED